jgi:hypothetical protein
MGLEATAIAAIAGGVGATAAVVGTIEQRKQGKRAAAARTRSEQTQQRIRDAQTARERRQQVRQARQQRAQIQSTAVGQSIQGSSSAVSGASQVGTQLGANLSFIDTVQGLSRQASIFNIDAANAQSNAAFAGSVAGLGTSIFNAAGGFSAFDGV